jgi:clan AA aspartic protease
VGHVYVDATIRGTRAAKVRFLVDRGATYNLIPAELAQRLGIEPGPIRDRVRLATGRTVRLPTALGAVRIDGREAATIFWIGPCEEPLLGVEALEALGLALDPRRGQLRPTRPYATRLGGFGGRR